MSSYPPVWVKQDTKRFPRVVENGRPVNILSTFGTRLNGDENDQGECWRFDPRELRTEKVTLYRF